MERFQRFKDGLMLVGVVMALFGGMALAMAAGLFVGGPKDAHAQVTPGHEVFRLCKKWETTGTPGTVLTFTFDVSDISQTTQNIPIPNVMEGGDAVCILLEAAPGLVTVGEDFRTGRRLSIRPSGQAITANGSPAQWRNSSSRRMGVRSTLPG